MRRRPKGRRAPAFLLVLGLAAAAAVAVVPWRAGAARADEPPRAAARIMATTARTVYIDAGAVDGLAPGQECLADAEGRPVALRVVAVADGTAVLEPATAGAPLPPPGVAVRLPAGAARRPPTPAVQPLRAAPSPPWHPDFAALAWPLVRDRAVTPSPETTLRAAAAGPRLGGELAVRLLASGDLDETSRSYHDTALLSQLHVEGDRWRYDHLIEGRLVSAPLRPFALFEDARARFDVYLLKLDWGPAGARLGASLGRLPAAPGTAMGLIDGARARLAVAPGLEVGLFGGLRPTYELLEPSASAARAGASAAWRRGGPGRTRVRADAAFGLDSWRGDLERAYGSLGAGVVHPRTGLSASGELVLDAPEDETGASGARVTRAALSGSARLLGDRLAIRGAAGTDRPVVPASLAAELPDLLLAAAERHFVLGDVDLGLTRRLQLGAGVRAAGGDDDLGAVTGDLTLRAFGAGPPGALLVASAHATRADLGDGVGGRLAWDAVSIAGLARLGASVGVDGWVLPPDDRTVLSRHARFTAERPLGARWRLASALEAARGAGPTRVLVFVLLGWRVGG